MKFLSKFLLQESKFIIFAQSEGSKELNLTATRNLKSGGRGMKTGDLVSVCENYIELKLLHMWGRIQEVAHMVAQ